MALPAVTTQRIEAVLKDEELEYGIDDDNEVFASFVNANFFYRIVEDIELLFIYGYWRAETADSDLVARLREFRTRIFTCPNSRWSFLMTACFVLATNTPLL